MTAVAEKPDAKPAEKPKRILRVPVAPEIAAEVFKRDEAVAVAQATGQTIVNAAIAAAETALTVAVREHQATIKPILIQAGIEQGKITGSEGMGAATVLLIEVEEAAAT